MALAYAGVHANRSISAWKTANALAPDDSSIARLLCASALAEGRHNDGLLVMDRLGQYHERSSELDEHVGLAALAAAAVSRQR